MNEETLKKINNLSKFLIPNNKNILNDITEKLTKLQINEKCAKKITSILEINYTYDFLNEFLVYLNNEKINLKETEKITFDDYFKSKNKQQWHQLFKDLYNIKYDNNGGKG
jgi:SHS2 domain-containing protein